MSRRVAFMAWLKEQEGKPYIWNADGPRGYDCSGLVCAGILAVGGPDWRATHNSDRLWRELTATELAEPGDFVFYGPPHKSTHVMVQWWDGRVYGATGGGSQTTEPTKGACVQFRSGPNYRPDLLGYRRFPLED